MKLRERTVRALIERMVAYLSAPRRRANLAPDVGRILQAYTADERYADYFRAWEAQGVHVTRNAFYSPIPDTRALGEELWGRDGALPGVDMNESGQLRLLSEVFPRYRGGCAAVPVEPTGEPWNFHLNNGTFDGTDALVLYCMVRHLAPRRVLEIGSGFSTRLLAEAARESPSMELVAVDPYPGPVVASGIPGLTELVSQPVEALDLERFLALEAGDVLFIDSSHALRCGGDVQFLYLEVLPRLRPGVVVHVHDIFFPREYPRQWLKEHCIFWTEQYLLQAFLAFNTAFEVLFANQYIWQRHPEQFKAAFPMSRPWWGGGSIWLRRRAEGAVAAEPGDG